MTGIIFSIIAGMAMSIQGVMNTRLGEHIGVMESNAFVQSTAAVLSWMALMFYRTGSFGALGETNRLYWFGGVLGLVITVTVMLGIALVQSYSVVAKKTEKTIEAFGESKPVATIAGQPSYTIELSRLYATDTAVSDGISFHGRGMQALLLDNEAESADYFGADLDYILSRHVLPLGINDIDTTGAEGTAASFSVDSGVSHWSVLRQFAEFCCGVSPRFAPDGTLVLDGESGGGEIEIGGKTPVTGMTYREDRYGVISSVRVKKYSAGVYADVENPEFIAKGGRCQRVINVPRKTGYDAMRHTGEYQIKESMKDHKLCFVTMPGCFLAFPGDRVTMRSSPIGLTGEFLVRSSRCRCDGRGAVTELEMRRI